MEEARWDAKGMPVGRLAQLIAVVLLALPVAALLLLGPFARFVQSTQDWLRYPYPRAGSEGLILYESLLIKHGGDIYGPITPSSFISGPYPPVYYWLAAATLPDALPEFSGAGQPASAFLGGRIISLVSAAVAAALLPLIVVFEGGYRRRKASVWLASAAGLAGSIAFLSLPQTIVWASRFRGDMLMVGLTACGLLCIAAGASGRDMQDNPDWAPRLRAPALLLGAIFFALAFFTKQTALAGPVAAGLYLLLRDWRAGLRWCLAMALCVAVPFLLLDVATGNWFYLKMVSYHSLPLRAATLTRLLQFAFWENEWPIILIATAFLLYNLYGSARAYWTRRQHAQATGKLSLMALFILATFAFLPTGAVVGADHNHLLVPGLAISLGAGAALAWIATRLWSTKTSPLLLLPAAALLLLVLTYAAVTSPPTAWYNPDLTLPSAGVQEQYRKIVENVRRNPGTLFFSDDPGIIALAGKHTTFDDPFTMTALAQSGRWDESTYRAMLQNGKFSLLVLSCDVSNPQQCRADTFTPGVLDAISAGYRVLFRDIMYTYAPR